MKSEQFDSYVRRALPILHRYAASSGTLLVSAAAQFLWFIILARQLGIVQFGQLMVIVAVTSIAAPLCGIGCGEAVIRRTARDPGHYPAMLGHALILSVLTGVLLTIASTLILCALVNASAVVWVNVTIMAAFSIANIVLYRYASLVEQVFIGFFRFTYANIANIGFSLIRLLTTVLACLVFHIDSLAAWAAWTLGGHLFACAAGFLLSRSLGHPVWRIDRDEMKLGFHFTTPRLMDALRQNTDRLVLGMIAPASVLGSYGTASRMAQTSQTVVGALNRIFYPKFAQRKDGGFRGLAPLATRYVMVVTGLATATAVGVYLVAPLMPYVLGHAYQDVVPDLRILCWLLIPVSIQTVPYDIFGALDRHSMRAAIYNTMSLVGVCGTAIVTYTYGITGAFISAFVVQTALAGSLWIALFVARHREKVALMDLTSLPSH